MQKINQCKTLLEECKIRKSVLTIYLQSEDRRLIPGCFPPTDCYQYKLTKLHLPEKKNVYIYIKVICKNHYSFCTNLGLSWIWYFKLFMDQSLNIHVKAGLNYSVHTIKADYAIITTEPDWLCSLPSMVTTARQGTTCWSTSFPSSYIKGNRAFKRIL